MENKTLSISKQLTTEILNVLNKKIKKLVKSLLERLMREERKIYVNENSTYANGFYNRTLLTNYGAIQDLRIPRSRDGKFHPCILPYRKRSSIDLSEMLLALYASGVSVRKISQILENIYSTHYSPQSISRLVRVAEEEVTAWRNRKLDDSYFAIFLDGSYLSIRRGTTAKEPVYLALGIKPDGKREILGFWLFGAEGESSNNWMEILEEIKRRGVKNVQLFITDDLPGMQESIKKVFPSSAWQLCVLHTVRNSLNKVRMKDRAEFAEDLKKIYRVETENEANLGLANLRKKWGKIYPKIVDKWEMKKHALLTFLRYPKQIRSVIYTTNQIERLSKEIKRRTKVIESFSNEASAERLLYLILTQMNEKLENRRLKGFSELNCGDYHVLFTQ